MFSEACFSESGRLFWTVATILGGRADWRRDNRVVVLVYEIGVTDSGGGDADVEGSSVVVVGTSGASVLGPAVDDAVFVWLSESESLKSNGRTLLILLTSTRVRVWVRYGGKESCDADCHLLNKVGSGHIPRGTRTS